jgi:PAS domain S-box-containing protein
MEPDRSGEGSDLFRRLVEHSLGLMCIHDLNGTLLYVNAAAARSLGFHPDDGVGENLRRFLSPEVGSQFDAYLERIRAKSEDSGLMRLVAKDGTERVWRYRNILHEEPGMAPCVLGHAQDVTDQVRAERALRESERRFRLLADTAPVMIWMSDPGGGCAFLNQPWLAFTGQSLEEQRGDGWIERIHPEDRERVREAHQDAAAVHAPLQVEYRLRRADGEYRWMLSKGVPRVEADGGFAGLVGSSLDITEIRRAREVLENARDELTVLVAERRAELRESNEQLRAEMERRARIEEELARARRLESLGALATGIAGEFGNLLTVIVGRSHAVSERLPTGEPARRDIDFIQLAAQRAADLIERLLAFARRQPLQRRLFNLNHLVTGMSLSTVIGWRAELSLRLEDGLQPASVDRGQIQRAIVHLVEHACEAMPAGGQVSVETANVDLDEAFARAHPVPAWARPPTVRYRRVWTRRLRHV